MNHRICNRPDKWEILRWSLVRLAARRFAISRSLPALGKLRFHAGGALFSGSDTCRETVLCQGKNDFREGADESADELMAALLPPDSRQKTVLASSMSFASGRLASPSGMVALCLRRFARQTTANGCSLRRKRIPQNRRSVRRSKSATFGPWRVFLLLNIQIRFSGSVRYLVIKFIAKFLELFRVRDNRRFKHRQVKRTAIGLLELPGPANRIFKGQFLHTHSRLTF